MTAIRSAVRTVRFLALAVLIGAAAPAQASVLTLPFGEIYSASGTPTGPAPWATATFEDIAANTVKLTIALASALSAGEFVSRMYFNFDPSLDVRALHFSFRPDETIGTVAAPGVSLRNNTAGDTSNFYRAGPDGFYDIRLAFSTSNRHHGAYRFSGGESVVFEITAPPSLGLDALDFDFLSVPKHRHAHGAFYAAAHLQGIPHHRSAWIGVNEPGFPPSGVVPLPGAVWLLGAGLIGLAGFARRKRRGVSGGQA